MKNNVMSLAIRENGTVQTNAIDILQSSLGRETSRDVIERAAFEISDRLCSLEEALHKGDLPEVGKIASSLVGVSAQIGLSDFAIVAQDLVKCVNQKDYVAIAAVCTRLMRLSETSLFTAVDYATDPI